MALEISSTPIGQYFNNGDYRTAPFPTSITAGAGDDLITTTINGLTSVDGGAGYDIFVIGDGFWGNFSIDETANGWLVHHGSGADAITITVTNVEMLLIGTYDKTNNRHSFTTSMFFDDGDNVVDFNALNGLQQGFFGALATYIGYGRFGSPYLSFGNAINFRPDIIHGGAGNDTVHLPDAAHALIYDDAIDGYDVVYQNTFYAEDGDDHVYGGDMGEYISGGAGLDTISGGGGDDTITDDPFKGYFEFVGGVIDGGAGNDTVTLAYSPNRIVTASGKVVWTQGGAPTYTGSGQTLFAQYLDSSGKLIGSVRLDHVETISGLLADSAPVGALFDNSANLVNFNALTFAQTVAINKLDTAGNLSAIYGALDGNDVVVLPQAGALLGNAAHWDASVTFNAGGGSDLVTGSDGADRIDGGAQGDILMGAGGADLLIGGEGDDQLNGGTGADDLQGGFGDDIYTVDDAHDRVTEVAAGGIDLVLSSVTFTLDAYFENLTLTGTRAINGTGNDIANTIIGNGTNNHLYGLGGDDLLDGGAGRDIMEGGVGSDLYRVDSSADQVIETGTGIDTVLSAASFALGDLVENLTLQGSAAIDATGNALNNVLIGNSAANVIDGREGDDLMAGGGGEDRYYVDSLRDLVTELAGGGSDTVLSAISYALGDNVEDLTLTGTFNLNGTGNALVNRITGNSGANRLDGGVGADVLMGFGGKDTYVVDNLRDRVTEASADGGIDTVESGVSYTLGANLENLTLTGLGAIKGIGNGLDNVIVGNAVANMIDGRGGADTMRGGDGDDTYFVDSSDDQVIEESLAGGTDTVRSGLSWTLSNFVEVLRLSGTAAIDGTGNDQDNRLYGNAAANVLDGGLGGDFMDGGAGDDTYIVDSVFDCVREGSPLGGTDLVQSAVNYRLGTNVENLILTYGATVGIGNGSANVILGNLHDNQLDGRGGADMLFGGAGDDTYFVDNAGDRIFETETAVVSDVTDLGGKDAVVSTVGWTLGAFFENLTLEGTGSVAGTGNGLANTITGNEQANVLKGLDGNDVLRGGGGNDTLSGGAGRDVLTGGTGTDSFVFDIAPSQRDTITDFSHAEGDLIVLSKAVFAGLGDVGAMSADAFAAGAGLVKAQDASDRIIYNTTTGVLFYDADGAGGAAAVQIAQFGSSGHPALVAGDFQIVL